MVSGFVGWLISGMWTAFEPLKSDCQRTLGLVLSNGGEVTRVGDHDGARRLELVESARHLV